MCCWVTLAVAVDRTATIHIVPAGRAPITITAEVVSTPTELSRGLMGRRHLRENRGMWFVMPEEVQHPFWMKDTYIPLDILFIGADYRIADIIPNTKPLSEELLRPRARYRYVLEVRAGFAAHAHLRIGDRINPSHK